MTEFVANRACPICSSRECARLGRLEYANFDNNPLADAFDIVACQQCAFVYCDTPSSEQDFDNFYKNHYYVTTSGRDNARVAPANVVKVIGEIVSKDVSICELGCGRGQHLLELKRNGFVNLYGIEPSSECVNYLKAEHGIDVVCGPASSMPSDRAFDVIISEHTIEHVLNLNGFVSTIAGGLTDTGFAYIELPNLSDYSHHWPRDLITAFEHINHFTISSLSKLFANHDLGLKSFGSYVVDNVWRGPMPVLYAAFQKGLKRSIPPEPFRVSQISDWLNSVSFMNEDKIRNVIEKRVPIYIWGINFTIQKLLSMSVLKNCSDLQLIDRDPGRQGRKVGKYTVQPPEIIKRAAKDAVVLICEGVYRNDIESSIRQMGCHAEVVVI